MAFAESALDRLSCGLGGKTMMPHVGQNIPGILSHPDWRYRSEHMRLFVLLSDRSQAIIHTPFRVLNLSKPLGWCLEVILSY